MPLPLLTLLGIVPIIGALVVLASPARIARLIGGGFALGTLGLGVAAGLLQRTTDLSETLSWVPAIGAYYALKLDGMASILVIVTTVVTAAVLLAEWNIGDAGETPGRGRGQVFFALALLLEGLALFAFMAADVLFFYIVFEATLIPMYFLIGGWGGVQRGEAALRFLLFSLAGGLVMLAGLIGVIVVGIRSGAPSLLIVDVAELDFGLGLGRWIFVGFFIAFAIKAPMVGVHSWLPDVAERATPGATALLVGILDNIGVYGMIRLCLGIFGEASSWAKTVVLVLAVISIIYGAMMAIASRNLLRLVAFTSISHFGFMIFGVFAFTTTSIGGSIVYLFAHGLSSAALLLIAGFLIKRAGTAEIAAFGGLAQVVPVMAGLFLMAGLATLALPGFAGFVGEFLVLAGGWQRHPAMTVIAALGTVLAAVYVILAYHRIFTGEPEQAMAERVNEDLTLLERLAVGPLLVLLLLFGLWPAPLTDAANETAASAMTSVDMSDPAPTVGGNR